LGDEPERPCWWQGFEMTKGVAGVLPLLFFGGRENIVSRPSCF